MQVAEKLMTVEEFMQLPNDGKKYELVRGELVEVCRPIYVHGKLQTRIAGKLDNFVDEHDLGEVFTESGVITNRDPDSLRGPDVGFISKTRLQGLDLSKFVPIAPDLVIEIVSDSDKPSLIDEKINEYLAAGTRLVWVIYPASKRIAIYDDDGHYKGLDINGVLDGGEVVPGFTLTLHDLFKNLPVPSSDSDIAQGDSQS